MKEKIEALIKKYELMKKECDGSELAKGTMFDNLFVASSLNYGTMIEDLKDLLKNS